MSQTSSRKALGRGLGALIPAPRFNNLGDDYFMCPVADVHADPHQPRQTFEDGALDELVASIKEKGILQPIVVRKEEAGYVIVAGERRLRAAKKAGLVEVPVLVKDVASDEAFELALIENIQRQDLNAIEEANAYARLLSKEGQTHESLARRLGKDRSTVANAVRLLKLPTEVQQRVIDGKLSAGHARAVLSLDDAEGQTQLADRIVDEALSVRQAEAMARAMKAAAEPKPERPRRVPRRPLQPYYDSVAKDLTTALSAPVQVESKGRKHRIVIEFQSVEDLRRLRESLLSRVD